MSDQPTGEWTAQRIINAMLEEQKANPAWNEAELWGIERDIVPLLRTRINAALAAMKSDESEYYRKCYVQCSKDFQQLRKQLVEHEKAILTLTDNCKHWRTKLTAYKQQSESMLATSKRVNDQLREQLAAEREKVTEAQMELAAGQVIAQRLLRVVEQLPNVKHNSPNFLQTITELQEACKDIPSNIIDAYVAEQLAAERDGK